MVPGIPAKPQVPPDGYCRQRALPQHLHILCTISLPGDSSAHPKDKLRGKTAGLNSDSSIEGGIPAQPQAQLKADQVNRSA